MHSAARKQNTSNACQTCHPVALCSSLLCRGVESYEVPDAIPLPGSENLDARFANYGLVKHFCCYFTNGQHLKDYFQNKEASTWILLLPVWTCLLPHRFISGCKLSNSLFSCFHRLTSRLTSPCLLELAVNTTRLLNLNLPTKNTISNKHKRRSIKITASKIIINKGTRNRTTTTTTR